jgi:hypothetical protein|tara:strand:+ start:170 stop:457 length:288 start_codon:yes stop_codon:yes gene_type:complete
MKPFTNKHSHEARERGALMNDMPIDNRGVGQFRGPKDKKEVKTPKQEKRSSLNPFNPMYSGVFQGTNPFIKTSKGNISERHGLDVKPKQKSKLKR